MDRETTHRLAQLERRLNTVYNNALQTAFEREQKALERFLTTTPTDANHARYLAFQRGRTAEMVSSISTEIANVNVIAGQMINSEALNAFTRGYTDTVTDIQGQVRQLGGGIGQRVNWTMYNRQALNAIFNPEIFEGAEAFSQVGYRQQWQPANRRVWDSRVRQDRLKGQYYYNKAMGRLGDDTVIARRLRSALAEALVLGEGMPSIATRLRAITQSSRKQAMRISRTETLRALNQGAYLAAEQAANEHGIELEKVWHSALDEFTRQSETADHVKAHGVTAPRDKHFIISGEALMYPLDPNGSAANIINCRCSHSYRVVGINRTATQHDLMMANAGVDNARELRYNETKEAARAFVRSDAANKNLNVGNQKKHLGNNTTDTGGRSLILGDMDTAQSLVNIYHGTGDFKLDRRGNWTNKEFITLGEDVGIHVDGITGVQTPTNTFAIHYGKRGTHIVPSRRR